METTVDIHKDTYRLTLVMRLIGLCPVSFRDVSSSDQHKRCRISYSKRWLIYSYIIFFITSASHVYYTFFRLSPDPEDNSTTTLVIVLRAYTVFNNLAYLVGIIKNVNHLQADMKIYRLFNNSDSKLTWLKDQQSEGKTFLWLSVTLVLYFTTMTVIDYAFIPVGPPINNGTDTMGIIIRTVDNIGYMGSFQYMSLVNLLLIMYYTRGIMCLYTKLENANTAFKCIVNEMTAPRWLYDKDVRNVLDSDVFNIIPKKKNFKAISKSDGLFGDWRANIKATLESRLSLHEAAYTIELSFGTALFTSVMTIGLNMIPCCFAMIHESKSSQNVSIIIDNVLRLGVEIIKLILLAENSFRVSVVASKTKMLAFNLLTCVKETDIRSDIKLFLHKIDEKPIKFSGLAIFVIDRVLIINIFIAVMSNLAILVQFDKH